MSPRRRSRARMRSRWASSWDAAGPAEPEALAVVGDGQEAVAAGPGGVHHHLQGGGAVGRQVGVAVEVAADVGHGDQGRELAAAGGVDLAAVLAQHRRHPGHAEPVVDDLLVLGHDQLAAPLEQPVLAELEAGLDRPLADADVVGGRPGEVLEGGAPHLGPDRPEVDLEAVPGPDGRLGVAEGGDLGHLGQLGEGAGHRGRVGGGGEQVDVVDGGLHAPQRPGDLDPLDPGDPGQPVAEGLGQGQGHGQGDAVAALGHPLQGAAQVGLGAHAHPGQAGHPPGGDRARPAPRARRPRAARGPGGPWPGRGRARGPGPAGRAGPRPAAPPAWPPGRCRGTRGPWRRSPCRPRGWRPAPARTGWTGRPRSRRGRGRRGRRPGPGSRSRR